MSLFQEVKGYVGQKINGVSLNIDLCGGCVAKCPSCAVGSIGGRVNRNMTIEIFRKILDKAESECKIRKVQLYVYTDPCAHKDLHLFVEECTGRGIKSMISTILQTTKCDFEKVIEARPTEFRISFPGWRMMSYYQYPSKPEVFDRNFQEVVKLPRYKETKWNLVYHLYKDNGDEVYKAKALAMKYGLTYHGLPAIFMPLEKTVRKDYTDTDNALISHLIHTPEDAMKIVKKSDYCELWKQVTLDSNGNVFLCQLLFRDEFKLGMNFLDHPLKEIQSAIRNHKFCKECMDCGANQLQLCYSEMSTDKDPVKKANKKRGYELPKQYEELL